MSYWVEIHCDVDRTKRAGADPDNILIAGCRSDNNDNPAAMAERPITAAKIAGSLARDTGWKRSYGLWTCPGCIKRGLKAD